MPGSSLGTWHCKRGTGVIRCDYSCLSQTIKPLDHSCHVDEQVNTTDGARDHIPLRLIVTMSAKPRNPVAKRKYVSYDGRAVAAAYGFSDPSIMAKIATVEEQIRDLPPIRCEMDSTSHAHALNVNIEEIMAANFPKQNTAPREAWISADTTTIFKKRPRQWKYVGILADKVMNAVSWYVVRFWASASPSKIRPKPLWHHTRGPATKELLTKRSPSGTKLRGGWRNCTQYRAARNKDFIRMASKRAGQLVGATLNKNSRLTASPQAD